MVKQFHGESGSIPAALDKTIGGEFPCPICHSVEDSLEANGGEDADDRIAGVSQKSPNHWSPFLPPTFAFARRSGDPLAEEFLPPFGSTTPIDSPPPRV